MTTSVFETEEGAEKAKPINEAVVDHKNKIKPKSNRKVKEKQTNKMQISKQNANSKPNQTKCGRNKKMPIQNKMQNHKTSK